MRTKQIIIVGLTGHSGSGKSTVAKHLSEAFEIPYYGIGTYERLKFGHLGTPPQYHRKLGVAVTYYGLYQEHIEQIQKRISPKGIILESLYAEDFIDLLKTAIPNQIIKVVHIAASRESRIANFEKKTNLPREQAAAQLDDLDEIKVGFGLLNMIRRADITVENESDLPTFLRDTHKAVASLFEKSVNGG